MHAADDLLMPYLLGVKVKPPGINEFSHQSYYILQTTHKSNIFFVPVVPGGDQDTLAHSRRNIF